MGLAPSRDHDFGRRHHGVCKDLPYNVRIDDVGEKRNEGQNENRVDRLNLRDTPFDAAYASGW